MGTKMLLNSHNSGKILIVNKDYKVGQYLDAILSAPDDKTRETADGIYLNPIPKYIYMR